MGWTEGEMSRCCRISGLEEVAMLGTVEGVHVPERRALRLALEGCESDMTTGTTWPCDFACQVPFVGRLPFTVLLIM